MTCTVATHADASARRRDAIVERVQSYSRRGHAVEDSVCIVSFILVTHRRWFFDF